MARQEFIHRFGNGLPRPCGLHWRHCSAGQIIEQQRRCGMAQRFDPLLQLLTPLALLLQLRRQGLQPLAPAQLPLRLGSLLGGVFGLGLLQLLGNGGMDGLHLLIGARPGLPLERQLLQQGRLSLLEGFQLLFNLLPSLAFLHQLLLQRPDAVLGLRHQGAELVLQLLRHRGGKSATV